MRNNKPFFRKQFCISFALAVVLINSSFFPQYRNDLLVPSVTNDFSWVKQYTCIYELFNQDQWEKNPVRSFDSLGVHLTNKNYHPVNACHYALYCYDEYKATKNEKFKKAFFAQVKYLRDDSKYCEFDGDKVGYPYYITFHDLKPPWYSALAQSEAISVLARYYVMTKDATVLPLIVKIKNFMIAPVEKDLGTMAKTPEKNTWYEEYPNSTQDKEVLNGFFLALVALYDYSHLFPDDIKTKVLYDSAVFSAKSSIKFYDTGSWLKYNRGDGHLVANGYMKWQVLEMKLLYSLTGDEFFKNQFMLWATYPYNKPYDTQGCKITDYNFSVPIKKSINNSLIPDLKPLPVKFADQVAQIKSDTSVKDVELKKVFDGNNSTYCIFKNPKTDFLENREFYFLLKKSFTVDMIKLNLFNKDSTFYDNLVFYYTTDTIKKAWKKLKNYSTKREGNIFTLNIQPNILKLQGFKILFTKLKPESQFWIAEIEFFNSQQKETSDFCHYQTEVYDIKQPDVQFDLKFKDTDDFIVFYKWAKDKNALLKATWNQENFSRKLTTSFSAGDKKVVQFLIVFKLKTSNSAIEKISFKG